MRWQDLTDISAFVPATLACIGRNAQTGGDSPSLVYRQAARILTILPDLVADGTADFRIAVTGPEALGPTDFMF